VGSVVKGAKNKYIKGNPNLRRKLRILSIDYKNGFLGFPT